MSEQKESLLIGQLRKDLQIFRAEDNLLSPDEGSWIVFDPTNGQYFRIFEIEYKIISGLCKEYTFEEYQNYLKNVLKIEITKEKLNEILFFLRNNGLLLPEFITTEKRLQKLKEIKKRAWFSNIMSAYIFFRIPIWKPDKFFDKTVGYVRIIFNKWVLFLLTCFSLAGYILIIINWNRFINTIESSLTYSGLIRYSIVIIILKFFHELAHSYVAKLEGIRIRHIGIGMIVFFPRFYTDLTDSWKITDRKKRVAIDLAGILLEIIVGGLAAVVWINSAPGMISTLSYYLFAVSVINTLLINGNPLIRYDGYYMLADLFGVDNLQKKSLEFWEKIADRIIFGIKFTKKEILASFGKNYIFILIYGITSFFYRVFLYAAIVMIIYFKFAKALGIILALIEIQLMFIRPILYQMRRIKVVKKIAIGNNRLISCIFIFAIILVFLLPLPWNISLPCVTQSKLFSVIYLREEAFFKKLVIQDGSQVEKGQLIAEFYNPFIDWDIKEDELWLEMAQTELDQLKNNKEGFELVKIKIEQIKKLQNDIEELKQKKDSLNIYALFSGIFHLKDRNLNSDKWMPKGEIFGFVKDTKKTEILAYLKEEDVNNVITGARVLITLHNDIAEYKGIVESVDKVPFVDWRPSPLLDTFGGPIQVVSVVEYLFKPKDRYYCVRISLSNSNTLIPVGRTGLANVKVYKSITFSLFKKIISSLQKELTF